jgi:hypothetical protein
MCKNMIFKISFLLLIFSHLSFAQVNVERYLWEYPLQNDLILEQEITLQIRDEMQKIIDTGTLIFRPVNCRYSDVMNDHYALYHEPGRLLTTVAMTYPYLSLQQQDSLRNFVRDLFQNSNHRPWSTGQIAGDNGSAREFFTSDEVWGTGSTFGQYRPTIQNVYSIWLYVYRTGDTTAVTPHYNAIKSFYNTKVGSGIDPGNLYGTMSAHIGMARLAEMFDDSPQVTIATNHLTNYLNLGLDINYVDGRASQGLSGWNAPYGREYEARQDNWVYRGYIFLNLSPEMGRFLFDEVQNDVLTRHTSGKNRFPYWWVRQASYFCRWTGDEGVGIPTEMMGMIMPVERWVAQTDFETLAPYMLSAPLGVADCYWIESAVLALESNAVDQWVDVRTTPFETDIQSGLMIWKGMISNDWFLAANWDSGKVPGQNDHVIIEDAPFDPVIESGLQGYARNIEINTGAELIVRGMLNGM